MRDPDTRREALVRQVLDRFFRHYTVIVTINGHFARRPLFVRRDGAGSRYTLNPDIPDAFFEKATGTAGCPCCGAAPSGRNR